MPAKGLLGSGQETVFKIGDAADTLRTITSYVTKISMDLKGHGLVDVTTFGDTGRKWASDELQDCSFNLEAWFNDLADTGSWTVLQGLRAATTSSDFEIYPFGTSTGFPEINGDCFMENIGLDMSVAGIVKITASFKVHGVPTVGTAA